MVGGSNQPGGRAGPEPPRAEPAGPVGARPAYYASRRGGWRQWWTVLHPPYTAWHLGYVVLGAALAPRPGTGVLLATLAAFFLAVGIAAHAVDELHGRPLRTTLPGAGLAAAAITGLAGAAVIGAVGVTRVGWPLVPFLVAGPLLVLGYNAELFRGVLHTDAGFAAAWGSFPVLVGYVAQAHTLAPAPLVAAAGAFALSLAQRRLSAPAREVRRHAVLVEGTVRLDDGTVRPIDAGMLLAPLERTLQAVSWSVVLLAAALAIARLA